MKIFSSISRDYIESLGDKVKFRKLPTPEGDKYIYAVEDFPLTDPWSRDGMRKAIGILKKKHWFSDSIMELGIGDARNILTVGNGIKSIVGVDLEEWRVKIASYNLSHDVYLKSVTRHLFADDAVAFINKLPKRITTKAINKFPDRIIIILPQSLGGVNTADRFFHHKIYSGYEPQWGKFGLSLNAAVLGSLSSICPKSTEVLTVYSGRIPNNIVTNMINKTGWQIKETVIKTIVQQDPDTYINWMIGKVTDSGKLFQDSEGHGLTIVEADRRIHMALGERKKLDVYHELFVYLLELI